LATQRPLHGSAGAFTATGDAGVVGDEADALAAQQIKAARGQDIDAEHERTSLSRLRLKNLRRRHLAGDEKSREMTTKGSFSAMRKLRAFISLICTVSS
jgi:hypothetical protein